MIRCVPGNLRLEAGCDGGTDMAVVVVLVTAEIQTDEEDRVPVSCFVAFLRLSLYSTIWAFILGASSVSCMNQKNVSTSKFESIHTILYTF